MCWEWDGKVRPCHRYILRLNGCRVEWNRKNLLGYDHGTSVPPHRPTNKIDSKKVHWNQFELKSIKNVCHQWISRFLCRDPENFFPSVRSSFSTFLRGAHFVNHYYYGSDDGLIHPQTMRINGNSTMTRVPHHFLFITVGAVSVVCLLRASTSPLTLAANEHTQKKLSTRWHCAAQDRDTATL